MFELKKSKNNSSISARDYKTIKSFDSRPISNVHIDDLFTKLIDLFHIDNIREYYISKVKLTINNNSYRDIDINKKSNIKDFRDKW